MVGEKGELIFNDFIGTVTTPVRVFNGGYILHMDNVVYMPSV